jgi:hypothetical protein
MKFHPFCSLCGGKFSPSLAEAKTGLALSQKEEPGEMGKRGRYRNAPMPYGAAHICSARDDYASLKEVLDNLAKNITVLRECGAERIQYWLVASCNLEEEQCNLEFDVTFLKTLAELQVPLLISIY